MDQEQEVEKAERWVVPGSPFKAGDMIAGKYRIERELGRGGMGVVLAARHVDLDQQVAVKLLHSFAAEKPDFVARFAREARSAAKIRSEHVARIIDIGTLEDGTAYFIMEHLEGVDLAEVLRQRGALPISLAVDYLLQTCEAVAAAHAAGIIHRDLKPANLFIARNPDRTTTLKVLDFGVAKVVSPGGSAAAQDHVASATQSGHILGSPMYMSPEQLRGAGRVDSRADLWALGVVLFEMLTDEAPFSHGTVAEILASVMRDPAPLLRDMLADAPEELEQVIARCLEKDPSQRYASVVDLARALVPFGPRGAEEAVERMERLLSGAEVTLDVGEVVASNEQLSQLADSPLSDSGKQSPSGSRRPISSGSRVAAPSSSGDGSPSGGMSSASSVSSVSSAARHPLVELGTRGRMVGVAGLVLTIGLVVVAALFRASQPAAGASPGSSAAPASATSTALLQAPDAAGAPEAGTSLAAEVAITIDGVPPGTKIYRGVVLIGTVPSLIHLPRGADKVTLRFTADGYTSANVDVVPDADGRLTVNLTRAPVRPVTPAQPRRSKDLETF